MSDPAISFVVLSYNYARYIGDCLRSILAQEGNHDFEVIVVDDASTDDSDAVIRAFNDPRIRYIRHGQNQGHAATVTDGLRAARGSLVARIDSDDRYRSTFLNTVLPLLQAHPQVGLVYGDAAMIDDQGTLVAEHMDAVHQGAAYQGSEYVKLLGQNFICAPTIIARRTAWLAALPIPDWLVFHDWYFTLMIGRAHDFYFTPAVLAEYRVHGTNYHTQIARDKSEEQSVMRFLDLLFATPEISEALQQHKLRARRRVLAAHYLQFAHKYFWFHHNADARRCFWNAVRRQPQYLASARVARQFAATLLGRSAYEGAKRLLKRS